MKEKINHHLTNLFLEVKAIISDEIINSVGQSLKIYNSRQNTLQPLLTTDELASCLKVSKSHINKLRKKYKDFPVLNIDGSIRFRQSEVEEFFKKGT
ncbi:helix-turn-helix domain-containing protein [Flavobacterium sp. ST-75]|uniref:Helix-turn-helix domain-containing protein n=1 Tax=Flavobacterium rhizophilum TaxID=3163296 RepID=A0ABW8YB07_9FLAO